LREEANSGLPPTGLQPVRSGRPAILLNVQRHFFAPVDSC
jgi:hypothetical protein